MRALSWMLLGTLLLGSSRVCGETVPAAAERVRAEALRANGDTAGRPLPLVSHWHRLTCPLDWQLEMLRKGHHLLPWFPTPIPGQSAERTVMPHAAALQTLREWKLPLVLITGGQWEGSFYLDKAYKAKPVEETGCVLRVDGKKLRLISPFSPIEPWQKLGREWTTSPGLQKLQALYPDPPKVLLISNNEAADLRWHAAETSKRYMEMYGAGKSDAFKREIFAKGWIERYRAMIDAMRAALTSKAWQDNSLFVAYNALGPMHMGRPDLRQEKPAAWRHYSLCTKDFISPDPLMWEGAIPEYYDNHWQPKKSIWQVWSCQVEMMNLVFMKEAAIRAKPNWWHELIFWDGNLEGKDNDRYKTYTEKGHPPTPERYHGWCQYGLWLLTPRVAREWRASNDPRERWEAYFMAIVQAVDKVHAHPVLTRFWRQGRLVANRSMAHPFNDDIPKKWQQEDRWFHLSTDLDPKSWTLDQVMPVFTLAHVIGEAPNREWLVYGHAPMGDKKNVAITIPTYRKITVDLALAGSFYHVKESDQTVKAVGQ